MLVSMSKQVKIDFVSDVVCPWCALGLQSLLRAIDELKDQVTVDLHFQPFELNPATQHVGESVSEYLQRHRGLGRQQIEQMHESLRQRGEQLGFTFSTADRKIYNTFDAHRLLMWAADSGKQAELEKALFKAYFTDTANIGDRALLASLAAQVGLDAAQAQAMLESTEFTGEVRERQAFYRDQGISGVPAIIFNDRHLMQGAQPPEAFVDALKQLAQ